MENNIITHAQDPKCFCPNCQMSRKVFTTSMNRKVCYDAGYKEGLEAGYNTGYQAGLRVGEVNVSCLNTEAEQDKHEINRLRFLLNHMEKQIELQNKSHSNVWNMAYSEGYQDGKRNMEHKEWMEEGEKK